MFSGYSQNISTETRNFINKDYYYIDSLIKEDSDLLKNIIIEILENKLYKNDYRMIYIILDYPLDYSNSYVQNFIIHSLKLNDEKISEKIIFNDDFITGISEEFINQIITLLRESDLNNFVRLIRYFPDNRFLPDIFELYFSFLVDNELYFLKYDEVNQVSFYLLFEALKSFKETGLRFLLEELRLFEQDHHFDKDILQRVSEYSSQLLKLYLDDDIHNIERYISDYKNSFIIQVLFIPYLTDEIIMQNIDFYIQLSSRDDNINKIILLSKLSVTQDESIHRQLINELRRNNLTIIDKINLIKSLSNFQHSHDIGLLRNFLNDPSLDVVIETVNTMLKIDASEGSREIRRFILNTPLSRYLVERILHIHLDVVHLKDMEIYKNILYSNNLNLINPLLDVIPDYLHPDFVPPLLYLLDHHRFVDKSTVVALLMNILPQGAEALKRYFYEDKDDVIKMILDYSIKGFKEDYMFFYITALRNNNVDIHRPVIDFFVSLGQKVFDEYLDSYSQTSIFRLRRSIEIIREEIAKKSHAGLFQFENNFYSETEIINKYDDVISKKIFIDNITSSDLIVREKAFQLLLNYNLTEEDLFILSESIDFQNQDFVKSMTSLFKNNIENSKNVLHNYLFKEYPSFLEKTNYVLWSLDLLTNLRDYDFNESIIDLYQRQHDVNFKLELLRYLKNRITDNEVHFLVNEFFTSDNRIRLLIIDLLSDVQEDYILDIFVNLLHLDNIETQQKISAILTKKESAILVDPLISLLKSQDEHIVQNAIASLKFYESDTVYYAVSPFFESSNIIILQQTILTLGNYSCEKVFSDLITLYIKHFQVNQIKSIIEEVIIKNDYFTMNMINDKIDKYDDTNIQNKIKHIRNISYPYK